MCLVRSVAVTRVDVARGATRMLWIVQESEESLGHGSSPGDERVDDARTRVLKSTQPPGHACGTVIQRMKGGRLWPTLTGPQHSPWDMQCQGMVRVSRRAWARGASRERWSVRACSSCAWLRLARRCAASTSSIRGIMTSRQNGSRLKHMLKRCVEPFPPLSMSIISKLSHLESRYQHPIPQLAHLYFSCHVLIDKVDIRPCRTIEAQTFYERPRDCILTKSTRFNCSEPR